MNPAFYIDKLPLGFSYVVIIVLMALFACGVVFFALPWLWERSLDVLDRFTFSGSPIANSEPEPVSVLRPYMRQPTHESFEMLQNLVSVQNLHPFCCPVSACKGCPHPEHDCDYPSCAQPDRLDDLRLAVHRTLEAARSAGVVVTITPLAYDYIVKTEVLQ